jgi:CBS-domain-containing membrane protein
MCFSPSTDRSSALVSHTEKLVSALGGFVAIFCILTISRWSVGADGAALIVASMGASAVLLFAVPHGPLSQPWPVLGGHILSAVVGVSCAKLIPNEVLAASVAVGAAIGVMYYARCTHPPGGATALSAVVGGQAVHELGYQFVLTPILLNVLIILAVGFSFNFLFPWRRYPSSLHQKMTPPAPVSSQAQSRTIAHEDFVYALSELDTFVDINEDDLIRIYDIATQTGNHNLRS